MTSTAPICASGQATAVRPFMGAVQSPRTLPRARGGMAAAYAGDRRGNSRPNQEALTVDESSFRFAKLIGYKSLADVAGKGSLFVITVMAARRLDAGAFGVFSLASTVGWLLAVLTDFGIQLHLAR